jgi:D-alanyl-D-alanine carboxypeptidase/D-alanyl-D-alanine-endopeptidase (penicillin-binding protein 4)
MYSEFCNSLTIAGFDGTLRGRMINTPAHGNAHGKTGTLNGVTVLAGYVATKDGQLAGYFITMQNFGRGASQYKRIQDQLITKLANFSYAEYITKYSTTTLPFDPVTAPAIQR